MEQINVTDSLSKTKSRGETGIYAIASGKGGVGKTWLAITLSHALSNLGRKTLLFDGDLGLANVDIQLGLMPKHDLGHPKTLFGVPQNIDWGTPKHYPGHPKI